MPEHVAMGPGGEFDLIRRMLARWGDLAAAVGDDTGPVPIPEGERVVVSTDSSVEGVHFQREWISPREVGRRATMAALSDLAAAAVTPRAVVLTLALPPDQRSTVEDLADGVGDAVREVGHGARIVGGDLTRASQLVVGVTVIGSGPAPLGRAGARPGDSVYVTGVLGGPGMALDAWRAGVPPSRWARDRFAAPRARVAEGLWLAERGAAAMIDISDGLSSELHHLAAASGCEVRVDLARVPRPSDIGWREAVSSGEEYELLVAMRGEVDVNAFARAFGVPLTRLGVVRAAPSGGVVALDDGVRVDLPGGHDHFSR
ncbi:MAG: thiamine-phosphate kinase [Gemmatimonadetes bacterium]|nr:thiamine-phosphate kinase [Gemmatimonadota bacterium]